MAKIDRYNGNLKAFASEQLTNERTLFGEVAIADDLTSQITPQFLRGWGIVGPSDQPSLQDFNAAMYTNGQLLAYLHQMGVAEYNDAQEYAVDSITTSGGALYISLVPDNTGNSPAVSPAEWKPFLTSVPDATTTVKGIVELATNAEAVTGTSTTLAVTPSGLAAAIAAATSDKLNAPIATVAAAANINLTTGAPNTSQIVISGSGASVATITAAANRFFIVRFSGVNTLVNSASLVTNSGGNIVTAAGDTCAFRLTAANVAEILWYTPGIPQQVGYRQTWQNMSASRVVGTTYTNTSGRPITVLVGFVATTDVKVTLSVSGLPVVGSTSTGYPAEDYASVTAVIPPAGTYSVTTSAGTLTWLELRE